MINLSCYNKIVYYKQQEDETAIEDVSKTGPELGERLLGHSDALTY